MLNTLYEMSSKMHGLLNGKGKFNGDELYWSRGKIFSTEEEANELFLDRNIFNLDCFNLDCRSEFVDMDVKKLIKDIVYYYVGKFYQESNKNDEFLLLLGFSINLYYIVGLYSTFGKFDIKQITSFIEEEDVKEYAELINEYLYSKIISGIEGIIERKLEIEDIELYKKVITSILEKEDVALDQLYSAVKSIHRNYVPDLYMLAKENPIFKEEKEYLNEMIQNYPEFRFGWVYECLERGKRFYETRGNDIEVYKLEEKIGSELYWHILGNKSLDNGKYEFDDKTGEIKTIRAIIFSEFGMGIPKIKTITKEEYDKLLINSKMWGKDDAKGKNITFDDIRKEIERYLGIGIFVKVEYREMIYRTIENQKTRLKEKNKEVEEENKKLAEKNKSLAEYTKILYGNIENQKRELAEKNKELEEKNKELEEKNKEFEILNKKLEKKNKELDDKNEKLQRLYNQRRTMIDHLAHSWGNECYPQIVKKVADELLQSGNTSLANRLFKAYNSETNLMGEIIFLQSAMADEPQKLKTIFCDSFRISGKGKKEWKIGFIIEEALEMLVFSLLNYRGDNNKRNICQNKLCVKYTLPKLAEDYSKRFENNNLSESFIDWFSEAVFSIKINMDKTWAKINFGRTEYGKIVMKNIFTELFTNVLFHGNIFCEISLESKEDKMYIIVKNKISDLEKGKEKGLSSMKEVIAKLNYGTSVAEEECILCKILDDSIFETRITLAKKLMYIDKE